MNKKNFLAALAATAMLSTSPVFAENEDAGTALPEICKTASMHDMGAMRSGSDQDMAGMDQPHQDLMKGMDQMNSDMMQGMTAPDVDVAFVCGMIPHHLGAISMAKAELANGDDAWAKEMAQKVIDAQEKEVVDMMAWLAKQSK